MSKEINPKSKQDWILINLSSEIDIISSLYSMLSKDPNNTLYLSMIENASSTQFEHNKKVFISSQDSFLAFKDMMQSLSPDTVKGSKIIVLGHGWNINGTHCIYFDCHDESTTNSVKLTRSLELLKYLVKHNPDEILYLSCFSGAVNRELQETNFDTKIYTIVHPTIPLVLDHQELSNNTGHVISNVRDIIGLFTFDTISIKGGDEQDFETRIPIEELISSSILYEQTYFPTFVSNGKINSFLYPENIVDLLSKDFKDIDVPETNIQEIKDFITSEGESYVSGDTCDIITHYSSKYGDPKEIRPFESTFRLDNTHITLNSDHDNLHTLLSSITSDPNSVLPDFDYKKIMFEVIPDDSNKAEEQEAKTTNLEVAMFFTPNPYNNTYAFSIVLILLDPKCHDIHFFQNAKVDTDFLHKFFHSQKTLHELIITNDATSSDTKKLQNFIFNALEKTRETMIAKNSIAKFDSHFTLEQKVVATLWGEGSNTIQIIKDFENPEINTIIDMADITQSDCIGQMYETWISDYGQGC